MYKIIGVDGKEYGPISAGQLRQWISQNRVNAQTRAKLEGATDWQTLGSFPEFGGTFPPQAGGQSPPFADMAASPPKTSGMAITSLVLGILGAFTCGITALIGLILGLVSMNKIKKSNGQLGGSGIAIAGTIVSAIFLLLMPLFAGLMFPAFAKAKEKALTIHCVNNVKQLDLAVVMYADSNSNRFPAAATWCDAIQKDVGNAKTFLCPNGDPSKRCHYAFNTNLDGIQSSKISNPANTVMIFEIDGGWNVSGGPELMSFPSRHGRTFVVGFADGHVEMIKQERFNQLTWQP